MSFVNVKNVLGTLNDELNPQMKEGGCTAGRIRGNKQATCS